MSNVWKKIEITEHVLASNKRIFKGARGVNCSKCDIFIPLHGEAYRHSRRNKTSMTTKYYCVNCFKGLWV